MAHASTPHESPRDHARAALRQILAGQALSEYPPCGDLTDLVASLNVILCRDGISAARRAFGDAAQADPSLFELVSADDEPHRDFLTSAEIANYFGSIRWAWEKYLPVGHVSLLVGESGIGKSYFAARLIAALTGAAPLPDGTLPTKTGNVVLVETEDLKDEYVKRLRRCGAPDSAVIYPMRNENPNENPIPTWTARLPDDEPFIRSVAEHTHAVAVVVDSLSGAHALDENSAVMRELMKSLSRLAVALKIPVIAVHHLRKRSAFEPVGVTLDRLRGSSTIAQFARSVFALWRPLPDDPTQADVVRVDVIKSSFGPLPPSFAFRITDAGLNFCAPPSLPRPVTALDRAVEFLRVELRKEPQRFSELLAKAEEEGISKESLYRARRTLGVVSVNGFWSLPLCRE